MVEPKIAIATVLADLIWQFGKGLPYVYYASMKYWRIFNLAVAKVDHQTTKFNSPPNFLAIRYSILHDCPMTFAEYWRLLYFHNAI